MPAVSRAVKVPGAQMRHGKLVTAVQRSYWHVDPALSKWPQIASTAPIMHWRQSAWIRSWLNGDLIFPFYIKFKIAFGQGSLYYFFHLFLVFQSNFVIFLTILLQYLRRW